MPFEKGYVPWNKGKIAVQKSPLQGKTYTEYFGQERAQEIRRKISKSLREGYLEGRVPWSKGKELHYKLPTKMTSELAYIAGVCLGDGWLSKGKYYNNRICFVCRDKTFADKYTNAIETLGLKAHVRTREPKNYKNSVVKTPIENQKLSYCIDVYCLALYNRLTNLYVSFDVLVEQLFTNNLQWHFLAGFFDSEGWHNSKYPGHLRMYNTDLERLNLIRIVLVKLGFHPTIRLVRRYPNDKYKTLYCVALNRKKEVSDFLSKVC